MIRPNCLAEYPSMPRPGTQQATFTYVCAIPKKDSPAYLSRRWASCRTFDCSRSAKRKAPFLKALAGIGRRDRWEKNLHIECAGMLPSASDSEAIALYSCTKVSGCLWAILRVFRFRRAGCLADHFCLSTNHRDLFTSSGLVHWGHI